MTRTNYECYKKLRLVAIVAVVAATKLAAEIAVVAKIFAAIQCWCAAPYIRSCAGSLG